MPRKSIPEIVLALSPRQCASALGIPYQRVADAITMGELVDFLKRRIGGRSLRLTVLVPTNVAQSIQSGRV
jgi:hypothetical protein